MKKYLLILTLFLQTTFVFGQSEWSEYGSWVSDGCFPQIMWRIKDLSNPKLNTTSVMVEFKNNYSRKVTFNFAGFNNSYEAKQAFVEKGNLLGGQQSSVSLNIGQSSAYTFSIKGVGARGALVEIYTLYFDNDYQHYQKCIDGSVCLYCEVNYNNEPACPNYSKNNTNSSASSSTNTISSNNQITTANSNNRQPNQTTTNSSSQSTKTQNQTEIINQVGSTITNTATLIDDAIAQAKAQKKANKLSYNDLDDHELFEALIKDVLIQFKNFGYNPTTPLTEIFTESNFKTFNSTLIEFKDFDITISWFYHDGSGETKSIFLTCYNETISNYFKNNKILNKLSYNKTSKITYINNADSKHEYNMMHVIDNYEFSRNTVKNLNELIIKTKEFKSEIDLIKKQQESVELKALADAQKEIADAGVEIPIETGKIVNESVTVKSIINNYITATGGYENMKAVKTITKIRDYNGKSGKSIIGYGKYLSESTYNGKQYKYVFNGISGYFDYNGEKTPFNQKEIIRYQKYKPFDILGLEQSTLTVGKIETIKGVDCYTIIEQSTQSDSSKSTETKYFEVKSGLFRGSKFESFSSSTNRISYNFFNDFREVDHIILPFSEISFSPNDKKPINRTIVKEIIINEPNVTFE
jgi:hypothetical protein